MAGPNTAATTSTKTTTTSSPTETNTSPPSLPRGTTQPLTQASQPFRNSASLARTALPSHARSNLQPSNRHIGGVEMQRSYARNGNRGGKPIAVTCALYVLPPFRQLHVHSQVGETPVRVGGGPVAGGPCRSDCFACQYDTRKSGGA